MARASFASFSFLNKPAMTISEQQNNLVLFTCCIPSPSKPIKLAKPKPRRRKNSLRPKILAEPYSPPRENPNIAPVTPREVPLWEPRPERNDEARAVVSVGSGGAVELRPCGSAGEVSGRSLARYGLYLIGIFVFQTVCAVWILGYSNSDRKKYESLDSSDSNKEAILLNGNRKVLDSNEYELGERIEEIKAMARTARENEKNKNVGGDESLNSRARIAIEKEIGNRLMKLQKSMSSGREGSYAGNMGKLGASSEAKWGNGRSLVFKKKLRFRSSPTESEKTPRGFGGFEKNKASKRKEDRERLVENGNGSVGDEAMGSSAGENEDIQTLRLSANFRKKSGDMRGENDGKEAIRTGKSGNGVIQESRLGRPSAELAQTETLRDLRTENDQVFKKENWKAVEDSSEHPVLSRNVSSRQKAAEQKPSLSKLADKQSISGTNMWWLDLPYVLVVLMRRGSDHEGLGGFYTLKLGAEAHNQDESSYTIAFQDRGDANNFCLLLESFFEDLGDVRADIVPLSIKELQAAINLKKWKVVVVKKGQLHLYAGQPFRDVEMALHALVEETQRT